MSAIVEAKGLVKRYRKGSEEICPVNGVDLVVEEGEFVAIRGPSGSGKSTLLHLLGGLDRADDGQIRVAGADLRSLGEADLCRFRNRSIGFVFQVFHLVPVLSAIENVELPLRLMNLTPNRRREQAELALELVRLKDRLTHRPSELSGGEQQRVAIARALVTDPKILLADEPTGDLDERTGMEILELFLHLHADARKTVLMVTHDPDKAARATRELFLHLGKLEEGPRA